MREKQFEAIRHEILRQRASGSPAQGQTDDATPPLPLGRIAFRMIFPRRIATRPKGMPEGFPDRRGFQREPASRRVSGINLRHWFGGLDQGSGGIEQKGAYHGLKMHFPPGSPRPGLAADLPGRQARFP